MHLLPRCLESLLARSFFRAASVALVAMAALACAVLWLVETSAQVSPAGTEVRLGARANDDGTISVGAQWREDGQWRGTKPRLSSLPADASLGSWYASSTVPIPTKRVEVEIRVRNRLWTWEDSFGGFIVSSGGVEWQDNCGSLRIHLSDDALMFEALDADCEDWVPFAEQVEQSPLGEASQLFRVVARRAVGNAVELGVQRLFEGKWEQMHQPRPSVITLSPLNHWSFSESLTLPLAPPIVSGELRRGAKIATVNGRMEVTVDGQSKGSRCGLLEMDSSTVTLGIATSTEDCLTLEPLFTICSVGASWECDAQRSQTYDWESQYVGVAPRIKLNDIEAERIVEAVYSDFVSGRVPPAIAHPETPFAYWSAADHIIYIPENGPNLHVVLHETAHAIVDGLGLDDPGHGANYAAVILRLWWRYAPLIDTHAAREDAHRLGLRIAEASSRAVSEDGIQVVHGVICALGDPGKAMCDAFNGKATNVSDHVLEGRYIGWGRSGDLWWTSRTDLENGALTTYVTKYTEIRGRPGEQAHLRVSCTPDYGLQVEMWWPGDMVFSEEVEHQTGMLEWTTERWIVRESSWGGTPHGYFKATNGKYLVGQLSWAAQSGLPWTMRVKSAQRAFVATFDLARLFNTPAQQNLAQCGLGQEPQSIDRFVGRGNLPDGWYSAGEDDDGLFRSTLTVESEEHRAGESVARLAIECRTDNELEADVWWRAVEAVPPTLTYRVGDGAWRTERWRTSSGTWGEDEWALHRSLDSAMFLHQLIWFASGSGPLVVRYEDNDTTYHASFDLNGVFETPVQRNLAQCGTSNEVREPSTPVIDRGSFSDDFWWGVTVADEENPGDESYEPGEVIMTYVVVQTTLADADGSIARLRISCNSDVPVVGVYWEVDPAVDKTVGVGLTDGQLDSREWNAGSSTWGEYRFKWNDLRGSDALELWTALYWAAQQGELLTLEAHARNRPSQTYTATFVLDGLFETPVQPNLARCGR